MGRAMPVLLNPTGHSLPEQFTLPDLLASCTIPPATNPHYERAGAESKAWLKKHHPFVHRKQAFFDQCCPELLCSRAYPYAGYSEFRTCCDFVNLLFVLDEISDDLNGKDAGATGRVFLDAMRGIPSENQSLVAKMTRDFQGRLRQHAGSRWFRRFLVHCDRYVDAITREAELRERGTVLDLTSFTRSRRENSAVRLCFGLFEYALGIDLPSEVFEHPRFMSLYFAACDGVCWANDVYSFNMEQAKGHRGNNVITLLMRERGCTLQQASDRVGLHFEMLMDRFEADKSRLPSWGPAVDAGVARYVAALEHWIRGNLDWSFETQRYFGADHREVRRTRIVRVRPPGSPEDFL